MRGKAMAPSLAESFTASEDALTYEFVLRKGQWYVKLIGRPAR